MVSVNTVGGDQLAAGSKRAVPGWFHINVLHIAENDKCSGVEVQMSVLAGKPNDPSVTDFVDSTAKLTFWYADASRSEEEQERTNAKLTALLIALDLITPAQLGQPVDVDEKLGVGRHALVHLRYKQEKQGDKWVDNPKFLDLAFNDFLHIDDPAGANVPKNVGALKFIPAECRHTDPKYFAFKAKPGTVPPPAANGAASAAKQQQTVAAGATDGEV